MVQMTPFHVSLSRDHGIQTPTRYNPMFRAWVASTKKIRGPFTTDCATMKEAVEKARDLFIAHHVVWC